MPNAAGWKRAAKRWRAQAKRSQATLYRKEEAMHKVGVSVMLATRVFDEDRGDRTVIYTESTEPLSADPASRR
jgi:hypothetical protein